MLGAGEAIGPGGGAGVQAARAEGAEEQQGPGQDEDLEHCLPREDQHSSGGTVRRGSPGRQVQI